jgi:hypothetical protein
VRVVAIDPGLKPGCVELTGEGRVVRASHRLAAWAFDEPSDLAATERQWFFGNDRQKRRAGPGGRVAKRNVDVNDLLKLAFRAGFGLACIPAARSLAILPQDWRAALGYGAGLSKEQVQKKIADNLTAPERVLFQEIPAGKHGDVLDAIGIGRAAIVLAATTTDHDWTLECRK